jgi:hypothetical protein
MSASCCVARSSVGFVLSFVLLGVLSWAQPASANHVDGFSITVTSIDSVTREVDVDLTETTSGGTIHVGPVIQWGDAAVNSPVWTSTVSGPPNVYKVSTSHTYPDLTTRTINATSDCCVTGGTPLFDSAIVDFGCSDTPLAGCRAAGGSQLQITNNADDAKDKLQWKWQKGAETLFPALGDPTVSTQYFLCIYDPGLALEAIIPQGTPKWAAAGSSGFKYKDKAGAAEGVTKGQIKSGGAGKAKAQIKGAGAGLDDPLPLTQPVTVQLQNNIGECWEHAFTAPEDDNSADKFKDKEP